MKRPSYKKLTQVCVPFTVLLFLKRNVYITQPIGPSCCKAIARLQKIRKAFTLPQRLITSQATSPHRSVTLCFGFENLHIMAAKMKLPTSGAVLLRQAPPEPMFDPDLRTAPVLQPMPSTAWRPAKARLCCYFGTFCRPARIRMACGAPEDTPFTPTFTSHRPRPWIGLHKSIELQGLDPDR